MWKKNLETRNFDFWQGKKAEKGVFDVGIRGMFSTLTLGAAKFKKARLITFFRQKKKLYFLFISKR